MFETLVTFINLFCIAAHILFSSSHVISCHLAATSVPVLFLCAHAKNNACEGLKAIAQLAIVWNLKETPVTFLF